MFLFLWGKIGIECRERRNMSSSPSTSSSEGLDAKHKTRRLSEPVSISLTHSLSNGGIDREKEKDQRQQISEENHQKPMERPTTRRKGGPRMPKKMVSFLNPNPEDDDEEDINSDEGELHVTDLYEYDKPIPEKESRKNQRYDPVEDVQYELLSDFEYHPDVCKGSNCGVQFHQINEAYDVVMSYLRGETQDYGLYNSSDQEEVFVYDVSDMWEEWMGWEGAGIRDYTSHINPYV